jgi:hypothetical protein
VSPLLFLYYLPISSPFPSFSSFLFYLICLSCTTRTLLLLSLFTSVQYRETTYPFWISVLLNCSFFSSPSSRRFFLCPSVHIIMFLGLGALQLVIYHGVELFYDFYTLPFFVLFYNLLPVVLIITHLFFVLVHYLIPLSLVPAFHPNIQSGVYRLCT